MKKTIIAICATVLATPALTDVQVQFLEGAPKDRFVVTNLGGCDLGAAELEINFAASNAGLIFDVTGSGAGVEVFQPFEVAVGANFLASEPVITDGDQVATLVLKSLGPQQEIAFTIDVDDTAGGREITVSDDEIRGATVTLATKGETVSAVLGANAKALLETRNCRS
ncbi:aggregation factor core [Pelagimonas varians]|uniref:Aggregation factor core protein MAFp3 n=1 Tax=Pelagimonas varians TaxID=696760 RepID=A0A238KEG9_9RHOB|nr:aggregation factor core [Pelagimonas varians]PYG32474.1 hypothetical protein C8N36_103223 [Pelagimonas varians]SMX41218.1 hypothetical protein PEV8663_02207 [Pelagimonas varians]